jgi:DNA-binding helix-hairpin-helix protein with protein kinase domain
VAQPVEVLTDTNDRRWKVARTLGAGGQGEVKLLSDGEHAAKIILAPAGGRTELERRIKEVRRLALDDLDIARPLALLAPPTVGYIMRFLRDMVPLSALQARPGEHLLEKWLATGGLRRRCRLLAHAGEVLHELHARGYLYGDVSPSNIFVSDHVDHAEAWLIDPDNIGPASRVRPFYTPGFGAPELVRGVATPDSLTDAHAFAVLVFQLLTGRHPWVGDAVADGEPELEERAWLGEFPWVDDPDDASNRCSTGIPAQYVMTRKLLELSRKAFSAARQDRTRRPSVSEWLAALHEQADLCVDCPACGFSLRPTMDKSCWACGAGLGTVFEVDLVPWSGEIRALPEAQLRALPAGARRVRCTVGGTAIVDRRLAGFVVGKAGRERVLELTADRTARFVQVRLQSGTATLRWQSLTGPREERLSRAPRQLRVGETVLLGAPDEAQVLLRLSAG